MTEKVLNNLEENDWIYEQVFNAMDDEIAYIKRFTSAKGSGATAGASVGSSVSLNRQTSGSTRKALAGVYTPATFF